MSFRHAGITAQNQTAIGCYWLVTIDFYLGLCYYNKD